MKDKPTNLELHEEDTDFAKLFEELMKPIPKEPYKLKFTPEETERLLEIRIPQKDNDGD